MIRIAIFVATVLLTLSQSAAQSTFRTEYQFLSGTDNTHTVAWDFWCTGGRNSGYWTKINVPSHWEQQGFGAYNYGRDYVTYGKNFRFEEEKGLYKYQFNISPRWKSKTIRIVFEGSMTDTEVKVNGKLVGPVHQGSFYRFSYDITDKLHFTKPNLLEVTVSKMSSDQSVNNAERLADYWIFGGIFRPVYLEAVPKQHIEWTAIDAQADGSFSMNAFLSGISKGAEVTAEILDATGKTISTFKPAALYDSIAQFKIRIPAPLQWTAETPNLYVARVTLQRGKEIVHRIEEKFGFRTIQIKHGDGIYLNGVKIKMKGVNRHVWWPETGRTVNKQIDLMDVMLIKEMNMNAVRCSHYPPDKSFLRLCDSLGLYVIDELAGWQKAYSTDAGRKLVREMVVRDVNHPSIIFWSNGNEGGHNKALDDDYALYDLSKRPVIHAHHRPGNHFNGIDCNHYEDYYSTKKILADSLIYMPTEFLHAQDDGGGAAALSDFWELHWKEKRGAGGFLWALVDEGLARTDFAGMIDVNGVNAPDGIVGPHREKEGSFYAIREIYSPVKIHMKALAENFDGNITLENRFHFTNLNQCHFEWMLVRFKKPDDFFKGYDTLSRSSAMAPSVAPGETGQLRLTLPANWRDADALLLKAIDASGADIYSWTWKIKHNAEFAHTLVKKDSVTAVTTTETDSTLSMKANGITIAIDKRNGRLSQLMNDYSAKLSLTDGPLLVTGNSTFKTMRHYPTANGYVIKATYEGHLKYIQWKMLTSGWVELSYAYDLAGKFPSVGISFNYPENFVLGIKWLGDGPYRVWKNRREGVTYNVWEKRYNVTHTGNAPWHYPEFKGYHANVSWMEFNTVEGKFTVVSNDEDLFVRLFDFCALSGKRPHPELPRGNISFLDCIPPTGTKLALTINANTANLGPSSELNTIDQPIKRTLYFFFGTPGSSTLNRQFTMPAINVLTD